MAGGVGSRFWPMSTTSKPKQFIDVLGTGRSLLQLTFDRFEGVCVPENVWVVTSAAYKDLVSEQLPEIPQGNILCEPCRRNTAPCIAYVSWRIKAKDRNANIVVSPSDHIVMNAEEFRRVVKQCLNFASETDAIITLGMKPTRPETGYGYIQADLSSSSPRNKEIYRVDSFREKPDLQTAQSYVAAGNYLWNAGIFVWNVETITEAIRKYTPALAETMDEMAADFYTEKEKETVKRLFPTCEKISIDYAVMEKASEIYTLPAEFGWSDLGSWGSLRTLLPQDGQGNAAVGTKVKMVDCKGCVVHVQEEKQVVLEGLDGYIVAEKGGRLLVCRLESEQQIKEFSKE